MKKIHFLKQQLSSILRLSKIAAKNGGREVCGLLLDNGHFVEIVQLTNRVKEGGGFAFLKREIRLIEKFEAISYHKIVGTFHSHPYYLAKPGENDIENAVDGSVMMIIDVIGKQIGVWRILQKQAQAMDYKIL